MSNLNEAQIEFMKRLSSSAEPVKMSMREFHAADAFDLLDTMITRTLKSGHMTVTLTDAGRAYLASLTPAITEEPAAKLPDMSYGSPNGIEELEAPTEATLGDELFLEVAPLPAATMRDSVMAAKDEHIDRLWIIIDKLIKTQISDMSPMECMTRLMELKRMALQERRPTDELPFEEEHRNYNADLGLGGR